MLVAISNQNRGDHAALLQAMHRERKHVFVDLLKWNVPVVDGQYEIDEFDDDEAIYLICVQSDRRTPPCLDAAAAHRPAAHPWRHLPRALQRPRSARTHDPRGHAPLHVAAAQAQRTVRASRAHSQQASPNMRC